MSNFFDNLAKLADTVIGVKDFVEGIKASTNSTNTSNKVVNSTIKQKAPEKPVDPETSSTMVTLNPSVENKIPVLYGEGFSKGTVVDAALDADGQSIWISYVLSEVTGNKIDGSSSEISLRQVLIDGYPATFDADGVHITDKRDSAGNIDSTINQLIEVYFYKDGSEEYSSPLGFDLDDSTIFYAYNLFPGWNSSKTYYKMAFALVKITFSQEKDLTSLPEFTFKLKNTMDNPGDVLNDYLTNARYGAGVPASEVRTT
jgi:hypothetical protein